MTISMPHRALLILVGIVAALVFHLQWMVTLAFADTKAEDSDGMMIQVRVNNIVNQDRIFLGDIALIHADPFLIDAISRIEIGPSPRPNSIKALEKRRVLQKIQSNGYLPENLTIDCPENVYIKRPGQELTLGQIEAFLAGRLGERFGPDRFRLEKVTARGMTAYPEGKVSFSMDPEDLAGNNGRITGLLSVYVDTLLVDRISISADLSVFESILFAARTLSKGEILNGEDVYEKRVNIHDHNYQTVSNKQEMDGKILQTSLRKDQAIRADYLGDPPLVRKGDMITLVASLGNLKIITRGISKEDGYENDLIRVENVESGRLVRGVVKERLKVEVAY